MVPAPQVVEDIKRGEADVGITFCCPPETDVVTVATVLEPIVLVVPNDHVLADAKSVRLQDLQGLTLALPELSFGVRRIFDRASHDVGLGAALNPALSSNTFEALRDFVRCGAGVAVLPYRAVVRESERKRLRAIPIDHESLGGTTIDVVTLRRRRLPRIVTSFIEQFVRRFEAQTNAG
jgi:DNA-binding transcriptional LysR family regulator